MYLSKLTISGFRKFGQVDAAAELTFQPGVTALIGKNDSGKTAIIDAVGSVANFGGRRIHGFG
mgnify:FL=1|tara:strand:- start:208 stop:396 length:189 start_codon:yes stop_codon:yes gene_type:complete